MKALIFDSIGSSEFPISKPHNRNFNIYEEGVGGTHS
jgi:hypothetical protein